MKKKEKDNVVVGVIQAVLVIYLLIPAIAMAVYAVYCHIVNFLAYYIGTTGMPCL